VLIPVSIEGWRGTSLFDWRSIRHAARHRDVCLTFGYNTAVFNVIQRFRRIPLVINMDGIEWSRARWGLARQTILYVNERIACYVGNELIADHPEIETYLRSRARASKITMITYGADSVTQAPSDVPRGYGLEPGRYLTLICRPIPENSVLELVKGFVARPRGMKLAILGKYDPEADSYHREVMAAADDSVAFLGPVYDAGTVASLRFHSLMYLHGHTVGGTNPSLVEAMAAGNAVLAHDNPYNRWTAGTGAAYFRTASDVADQLDLVLSDRDRIRQMQLASRQRHQEEFTWEHVAGQYEQLLLRTGRLQQQIGEMAS
jgi:glycosyltransferase involved in cell wall biosynthesis